MEEIEDIVRPCGLAPRKAKAIYVLSQMILEKHGGEVPDNFEDLEKIQWQDENILLQIGKY